MRESRNPFRLRRSENIDTDTTFLTLFEPGILDVISASGIPETVQPIRSTAGGGKTSLLRLFTPSVLNKLYVRRSDDKLKELYARLVSLGAIDDKGPKLLGVLLQCGRNYAVLQTLPIDQALRNRLFFGLLNARVTLGVLRNALILKGLEFPRDLSKISLGEPDPATTLTPPDFPAVCSGVQLYEWAKAVESKISAELDSFGPLQATSLPGHDSLFSLGLIRSESIRIDGQPIVDRVVLMMDDIHMLTGPQRMLLVERVVEARSRVGIWIAERFEALSTQEMLALGSSEGRDHVAPIELEWYWRGHHERFEKHVMRLAEKRVRASTETELETFRSCLESNLDGPEYEGVFRQVIEDVSKRIQEKVEGNVRFSEWIRARKRAHGSSRELAISWRALEILIERDVIRPQKGLYDDEPLDEGELAKKDDSSVRHAAELFLAKEHGLPYFYGPERIARLASLNIEQFLGLGGSLFEEVIAAELLRRETNVLSAKRQHAIMKKAAESFWNDIPNKVRHGRDLRAFLESVGKYSQWYTYRPTAPNDPGVGGTAIRMSERESLLDTERLKGRPEWQRFANLLASALAHNYLVADLDYKCKGERWMVFNLNRLLCVHFDLPLGYGLYKERPLDELCKWVTEQFSPPRKEEMLYGQ